ncbi:glycoside hydrolase family 19 protein [Massilia sp. Dwa41.01b]|uniref:glycoside hydrolase family 19 protein n=1 Tax=Massilia sp. Dwa41.01b TaxID=2709302 RepID=UPI00191F02D0|nr:glycoside hydrolase family 19 protein [Massilia sp. Dwa41.01b]
MTSALLRAAEGANPDSYYAGIVDAFNDAARRYGVDTPLRLAHFLAQIGHESSFRASEENGHYSAARMHEVFGCRGGAAGYDRARDDCRLGLDGQPARLRPKLWLEQDSYAGNPARLLSYVYANRLGNGDEESGDGYRYRGRGLIQLTGKANYQAFTQAHNARDSGDPRDFVADPDLLLSELKYAIESAFHYWETRKVNALADLDDLEGVTRAVNGGLNGLDDRGARLARIKKALGI